MNILKMKIVSKIIVSFAVVLFLSILTIGFLIYELNHAKLTIREIYTSFIVSSNSLSAEKDILNYINTINDFGNAIQKKDLGSIHRWITKLEEINKSFEKHFDPIKTMDKTGFADIDINQTLEIYNRAWQTTQDEIIKPANVLKLDDLQKYINEFKAEHKNLLIQKQELEKTLNGSSVSSEEINIIRYKILPGFGQWDSGHALSLTASWSWTRRRGVCLNPDLYRERDPGDLSGCNSGFYRLRP